MASDAAYPKILFYPGFDRERDGGLREQKGWCPVQIELENGAKCWLTFFDPTRLKQELELGMQYGRPYIAEPGLIIIPSVTVENIERVIGLLAKDEFFDELRQWPPGTHSSIYPDDS